MRLKRASMIAVLGVVTILSLSVPSDAVAQSQGARPVARTRAIDALFAEVAQVAPVTSQTPVAAQPTVRLTGRAGAKPGPREDKAIINTFIDDVTPWVLPPEAAPEVIESVGVLQCVPYARFMSGIGLRGDAWTWWDKAAGFYARGNHPEPGAVLSFPGIERMPLGHVAVVTQVLSARKILVDHANWPNAIVQHGAISRDIQVVDVSPENDWSEVRVQFGEGGPLGSVYPANGFIYEWNEAGVRVARPRFSLDYALWSPKVPSMQKFNAISYLWALPPTERKRAYAAAGAPPMGSPSHNRPVLVLGQTGSALNSSALGHTLAINRLDVGIGGRASLGLNRFVMQ